MACKRWTAISSLAAVLMIANTGCIVGSGANLGPLAFPIPVSPYFQKIKEDDHWIEERYMRVPILGPLTQGGPAVALDPPSDDEVVRAWERADPIQGGLPLLYEEQRNNVRIVKEKIADYVDPPRVVPLIGPAQLHHAHYKCTVYYSERKYIGWPIPHTLQDTDASEVLYIDHNHFHMVGDVDGGATAPF